MIPSTFEENLPKEQFPSPEMYVMENARRKALEVVHQTNAIESTCIVIGCDTVVVDGEGNILEKPVDEADAFETLTKLSGQTHNVYSGVALFTTKLGVEHPHLFYERTSVTFGPLAAQDIRAYIRTGEPMDKAGSYGIQGIVQHTMAACK